MSESSGEALVDLIRREKERLRSDVKAGVLMLLAERGPLTGLELVHAGAGRRGTLYVRLNLLEDRGLVVSEEVPPPTGVIALPQRLYTITDRGRAALNLRPGAQR